jgi:kynureninase
VDAGDVTFKPYFSRFLTADPNRLHFAAHSHHLWPDVSFDAHRRAWADAALWADRKWEVIFGEVLPEAQAHVARIVALPDPATVAFAPNTHELVMRILSGWDRPLRILTTDGEFHSFRRQARRLEEAGRAVVERVPVEPFASFCDRMAAAAAAGGHDVVYVSQVLFDSGFVLADIGAVVDAVPDPETHVVVDGYHAFMAVPTNLAGAADRVFYVAGGYKYAMSGEGVCFAHCPPGYAMRPVDTGWFAGFDELEAAGSDRAEVSFPDDGRRLLGATFDPSGLYRFNAVQRWLAELGVSVADIHEHVRGLQARFLDGAPASWVAALVPGPEVADRGHFLTFRLPEAADIHRRLLDDEVVTDVRGDRLRIGFGLYHDPDDVDLLLARLRQ